MFPVVDVAGTAFDRGLQLGRATADRVNISISNYKRLFQSYGISWDQAKSRGQQFLPVITALDPALTEEVKGIAEGSGRDLAEILALNCRTEVLPPGFMSPSQENGVDEGECTSIVVQPQASTSNATLLGQNWDWLGMQRSAVIILRVDTGDGRPKLMTLTEAGMLAKIGLNDRGLAVGLNMLRSQNDSQTVGVPVHVMLRHLLSMSSVAQVIETAKQLSYGSSSNILCADAGGAAASLELSPNGMQVIEPEDGLLYHTNHFLAPALAAKEVPLSPTWSTELRLERMQSLAKATLARSGGLSTADVCTFLQNQDDGMRSISRQPPLGLPLDSLDRSESVAGVVMDVAAGVMYIAPDVPSTCAFVSVKLHKTSAAIKFKASAAPYLPDHSLHAENNTVLAKSTILHI